MITVIGLGRCYGDITDRGKKAMNGADKLVFRTFLGNPSKKYKTENAASFDGLFESCANFDELNVKIADELIRLDAEFGSVAYCVDGDGYSDAAVCELLKKVDAEIIPGVGASSAKKPCSAVLNITATRLVGTRPMLDTSAALEITEIDNALLAGEVKLYLGGFYSDVQPVTLFINGKAETIALEQLDRFKKYDCSVSAFIDESVGYEKDKYCFADVLRIMSKLTAPDGCEWDKAQTHESIRINMIEEAYEAVAAIINDDSENLIEELGDVLLQTVFHSDMAERGGEFSFSDVVNGLCTKLVTRHTHIFGKNKAEDAEAALGFWEKAKAIEKNYKSFADTLDSVPESFPALLYAEKVIKKAAKGGYDVRTQNLTEQLKAAADNKNTGAVLFLATALAAADKCDAEVELMAKSLKFVSECKKKLPDSGRPVSEIL